MKVSKNGITHTIRGVNYIEFEANDNILVIIPASLGVPKIRFEISFNGKLVIKGDKSLIEFRKSFY